MLLLCSQRLRNVRVACRLPCLLAACVTLCSAGPSVDSNPLVAFRKGDYDYAFAIMLTRAQHCDASAQNYIGIMYHLGLGTKRNAQAAVYWYRLAAASGERYAQRNLATLYSGGQGVAQNYSEAYGWLYAAHHFGNATADRALDAMSDKLTANQIMRAKAWAQQWWAPVAEARITENCHTSGP